MLMLLRKSLAVHRATTRKTKRGTVLVKQFTEHHVDAKPKLAVVKGTVSQLHKPITSAKTAEIATRPDLMQFKRIENADGTNGQDAIKGKWNDLYAGVITVWKPENPKEHGLKRGEKYIVVNGHHRLAHAKGYGVQNMRVQVLHEGKGSDKETSGYTALAARRVGAEINIVDGKGSIYDQVKFSRDQRAVVGKDRSLERAREIGISGGLAASIAFNAKDSLYAAFFAEKVSPQQTEQIANAAPGDDDLQRLGVKAAMSGKQGPALYHYIMAVRAMKRDKDAEQQFDLFGASDSAINQAAEMAERAAFIQRGIKDRIAAVAGAVSRPEKAKELGVNVLDVEATKKELTKLKAERDKWDKWYMYPTLIAQTKLQPMVKAIGGKGMFLLRKSHVAAHTRQLKSGKTVQVHDYTDKRSKRADKNSAFSGDLKHDAHIAADMMRQAAKRCKTQSEFQTYIHKTEGFWKEVDKKFAEDKGVWHIPVSYLNQLADETAKINNRDSGSKVADGSFDFDRFHTKMNRQTGLVKSLADTYMRFLGRL